MAPLGIRLLLLAGIVLAAVGVVLAFGTRSSHPGPYPPGQRLLLPAALLILPMAAWLAQVRLDHLGENTYGRPRTGAVAMFSVSLALLGAGMKYDHPDAPWLLLFLPLALVSLAVVIWLVSATRARSVPHRWGACAGALMFAAAGFWIASGAPAL